MNSFSFAKDKVSKCPFGQESLVVIASWCKQSRRAWKGWGLYPDEHLSFNINRTPNYPDGAFGNSPKKKQEQPHWIVEKLEPCPIVLEKSSSSPSKLSKCNDFLLLKATKLDDSISNDGELFFCFI